MSLTLIGSSFVYAADLFNRKKYESAAYEVAESDGKFEIRDYPEIVVASAKMQSVGDDRNSAFRKLFQYISGKNEKSEKIAMTTPVFMTPEESGKGAASLMSFVVPADVVQKGAPKANSESVKLTKRPAGKFAVYRYSGRWTKANETKARKRLKTWMEKKGVKAVGEFEKASYDPPFTPPFMRRNEVLVRVGG